MASEAVDDAISHIDALIARLKTPGLAQNSAPPAAASVDAVVTPPPSNQEEDAGRVESDGKTSQQLAAPDVVDTKPAVLDVPRKKPLKTPGAAESKPIPDSATGNAGNFEKAHLQVGLVQSVDNHPVSEKLYCCKVEVANGEIRKVVAGLRKFIPASELVGKKVCVILNLKPAKLAGEVSEAMILAGDARSEEDGSEIVKVLVPSLEASVGDRIYIEGGLPSSSPPKQLSSKIWEKVVPLLKVQGGIARFDEKALVTSSGVVSVPDLPDGAGIH